MSIQYKQKKIMTLLAQKNTVFFVAFTLLLLFYVITMFQANATAKHQLNFIFIFCFIQTILAHLLTSSELLSGIRSGFDKLLFSYSWGIRKIVLYNFLYTFIYQLIIAITAFFLSIAYDFFVNDLHTFNSLIGFNNGIHGKFIVNLLCNMFIVLLIHFAFVLRIKNHIGNIIGTSVLLLLLATGVFANQVMPAHSLLLIFTDFFGVKLIFWEDIFWQFLSNRFFILTICILFFHFSLLHYAKNSSTAYFFTQKTFKRITYLFYSTNSFFALVRYHWQYIWKQKTFIILFLLLVVGIFMDYQNSPIHLEYHESFTAIEMIYFFSRGEILGILFSVFIIFIPLNLFDALRVLNFYRVNHATSISNAKIVFSIVVTLFLLFFLCLSILTILFWLMLSKFDITRFDLFCNVLVGIYYQFSIYFFAGCGFIVLYLITRKKSLTILLGIALCLLFGLIENKADRGDLHPNWYLLICFHTPSLLYSDIVWQTKAFFWYYWSTYMCYWCSLLLLFLYYLSSFYPRGEHCNLKQRFFYRKYERNQEKWFYVPAILCCITCFCAFQIVNIHAKERKKYSQNSQIEICTKESNHKIRDGQ